MASTSGIQTRDTHAPWDRDQWRTGTGKSPWPRRQRLIGEQSFLETNVAKMKGRFNSFIAGKRCMLVEEVTDNNGSDFYNSLKAYFTSPIPLEVKHGPVLNIEIIPLAALSNSRRPLAITRMIDGCSTFTATPGQWTKNTTRSYGGQWTKS